MLEQIYWIAGVVVAAVAVLGLFLKIRSQSKPKTQQNLDVSGDNNTVNQSLDASNSND